MVARKGRGPVSLRKKKSCPQSSVPSVAHCFIQCHFKVRYVRALWYTRQYVALSVACALSRNTLDLRWRFLTRRPIRSVLQIISGISEE